MVMGARPWGLSNEGLHVHYVEDRRSVFFVGEFWVMKMLGALSEEMPLTDVQYRSSSAKRSVDDLQEGNAIDFFRRQEQSPATQTLCAWRENGDKWLCKMCFE